MTVYDTQNYWVSGLCPLSGIVTLKNVMFQKLDLFPSSGEEKGTPTLLGLLERADHNHWTTQSLVQ
jgi:hypothetical protein